MRHVKVIVRDGDVLVGEAEDERHNMSHLFRYQNIYERKQHDNDAYFMKHDHADQQFVAHHTKQHWENTPSGFTNTAKSSSMMFFLVAQMCL